MIHALLPNRRDEPNDASSLAPSSLHGTSVTANPIDEHGNAVVVYPHPSKDEMLRGGGTRSSRSIETTTHDDSQSVLTSYPNSETVEGTLADFQSPPTYPTVYISPSQPYYTIHTRQTLRYFPTESISKYEPPPSMNQPLRWSSLIPEESAPPKNKGELSAYRQLISFQRSRRGQVTHPRVSSGTTVDRPQDLGVKILVLGVSNSGKTTLHKSMKIAFEDDDEQWRLLHKPEIYRGYHPEEEDVSHEDITRQ